MFAPVKTHKIVNFLGIISIFIAFILAVIFNALAGSTREPESGQNMTGLFINTVRSVSEKFELDITPSGFTFSIWGVIYFWLTAAIIFYLFSLFSSSEMGKLYLCPVVISPWYSYFFATNLLYNTAWIFTWDREQVVAASVLLFLIAQTNIISLGILARNIAYDNHQLREEKPKIYWLYVILGMNGQGVYTTWTVIASLLNLSHCLRYVAKLEMETVSTIALSTLLAHIIVFFILENTILDNYIRFLMTPYLVVIWASIGVLTKINTKENIPSSTSDLTKAILGVTCILLAIRIAIVILRQIKRPLGSSGISEISDKPDNY